MALARARPGFDTPRSPTAMSSRVRVPTRPRRRRWPIRRSPRVSRRRPAPFRLLLPSALRRSSCRFSLAWLAGGIPNPEQGRVRVAQAATGSQTSLLARVNTPTAGVRLHRRRHPRERPNHRIEAQRRPCTHHIINPPIRFLLYTSRRCGEGSDPSQAYGSGSVDPGRRPWRDGRDACGGPHLSCPVCWKAGGIAGEGGV